MQSCFIKHFTGRTFVIKIADNVFPSLTWAEERKTSTWREFSVMQSNICVDVFWWWSTDGAGRHWGQWLQRWHGCWWHPSGPWSVYRCVQSLVHQWPERRFPQSPPILLWIMPQERMRKQRPGRWGRMFQLVEHWAEKPGVILSWVQFCQYGKEFFSPSQLSGRLSYNVHTASMCSCVHQHLCAR